MGIKGIQICIQIGWSSTEKRVKYKKALKFTHKMKKNSLHIQLWVDVDFFHFDMNAK